MRRGALAGAALAAALAPAAAPAGAASYPKVEQLVAFRDGAAIQRTATVKRVSVRVSGRTCRVGAATPLAALVRVEPPRLRIRDYGSCSRRARDAAGLFVRAIGPDANRGFDGWVYKVDHRLATAGAGDPSGPFGRGRLRSGQRVTWFYCRLDQQSRMCQRTLALKASSTGPGQVTVSVRAYDDRGRSVPGANATVRSGEATATTDASGTATLTLPPGTHRVHAERTGAIRSFAERVEVG